MKKLRLKALSLGAREILSREQMKSINGGCNNDDQCQGGYCQNGNCWGGSDTGGGSGGGGQSCSPLEGAKDCNGAGGSWWYPMHWDSSLSTCVQDFSQSPYCA